MPFNNVISRTDAAAMIPEDVAPGILQGAVERSAALQLFRTVPMSTNQQRQPVLSALPFAYFVNGDTGLKQTTEAAWANIYLNVEEIATIVPIPEAVLDDVDFDLWGSIQPLLEEAIGRTLDAAIFFGTDKPATWPAAIGAGAAAAANTATIGATQANGGIARDIGNAMATVEADGYDVNGFVTRTAMRATFRNARDTTGQKLADVSPQEVDGQPVVYAMRGMWPTGAGSIAAFLGDFTQGILGIRQDITYKLLDQAVIQDNTGAIVFNLAQQDMVGLRVVARFAFAVSNPINREQPTEASRYPFGCLLNA
jgi:HK97 family phage major capsid protein